MIIRCAVSLVLIEIVFMPKGDDQGQNKYRRRVSETFLESKVVGLKCTDSYIVSVQSVLLNCFPVVSSSYQSPKKTNPMNIDIKAISLNHTFKVSQTKSKRVTIYSDIHSWIVQNFAKLFNKWQSFYLLMSAQSNRCFFLPLFYETNVNKSEIFNDRPEESESANKAISNLRVTRSSYFS